MKKIRADECLVEKGYYDNREEAKRAIMAGLVFDDNVRIDTAGEKLDPLKVKLRVKDHRKKYVSRGGYKLEKAINVFPIILKGKVLLDIGSSTGGFTDCALQNGIVHSYALDVGTNQLDYKLRSDHRVTVMEQTNFRHVSPEQFNPVPDVAVIDVSFISLSLILPKLSEIMNKGEVIALVKPQFEARRDFVMTGGIVLDRSEHIHVLTEMMKLSHRYDFAVHGIDYSPITGQKGNIEYLLYLKKNQNNQNNIKNEFLSIIPSVVDDAFTTLNH